MALKLYQCLKNTIGVSWRRFFRDGSAVNLVVLDVDPLDVVHPMHYTEWETKDGQARCCVQPNAATFSKYYLEPLKKLLESLE